MGKLFLAISLILLDQASKIAIIKKLHQHESFPVIKNIFHLTLVYNPGSAFGFFRNQNWLLIYITVFVIIFILYLFIRGPRFRSSNYLTIWRLSLLFILSGATGNLIDRLKFGYIVDFLDFRVWPIFNFADILITTGVLSLLFVFLKKGALK